MRARKCGESSSQAGRVLSRLRLLAATRCRSRTLASDGSCSPTATPTSSASGALDREGASEPTSPSPGGGRSHLRMVPPPKQHRQRGFLRVSSRRCRRDERRGLPCSSGVGGGPNDQRLLAAVEKPSITRGRNRTTSAAVWTTVGCSTGLPVPPKDADGFTEFDSGISSTRAWVHMPHVVSPPVGVIANVASGLDHHNQVRGDPAQNAIVQNTVQDLLVRETR